MNSQTVSEVYIRVLRYARQEFLGLASPERKKETIDYCDVENVVSKIDSALAYGETYQKQVLANARGEKSIKTLPQDYHVSYDPIAEQDIP